jgi:hypothetical protein
MDAIFDLLRGILPPNTGDAIGTFVAAALTVMVLSYIAGDNVLFRLAQHILIGCVAAYAVVVAVHSVLLGRLLLPLAENPAGQWPLLVPLALGLMLLARAEPNLAWLGNFPVAFLLGVGTALALGGAVLGTMLPQLQATAISLFDQVRAEMTPGEQLAQIASNLIIVFGTIGALLSFHFVRDERSTLGRAVGALLWAWGGLGRIFIWVAFGALFAGLIISRITLLVARVQFLLDAFRLAVR